MSTTLRPNKTIVSGFGKHMLEHWSLDPDIIYLNHGTVGAPPRRVLAAQQAIRDEIERQPSRFLLRELTATGHQAPWRERPRMREAADVVGEFLGVPGDELAFVDNATTGINAVLRSFDFAAGDEILITDLTYGAIANTARYVAKRTGGHVRTVELPEPGARPEAYADAIAAALGPRTRIAIVDHIGSECALLFPIADIAARCRARGVAVLVDGAHAPGAIPLDLDALGVDWYIGNLHKWAWTPRSLGILWAAPERRDGVHPTVISWGYEQGLTAEFALTGTRIRRARSRAHRDRHMRELGVGAVQSYNHDLAWRAGRLLAERWGTGVDTPESMIGTMITVPMPASAGTSRDDAARLRLELLAQDRIEIQLHAWRERLWVRVSAQIYNDLSDVERLAEAVSARL
jgi:isopenicillin-N epimerase